MKHRLRAAGTAVLLTLGTLAALLTAALPAQADVQICEQYGSTVVQNRYVVQNNRWGTGETQCVNATDTGFTVTRADGSVPTNGAPKSYPSLFDGCHYTNCSPGTRLPKQLSTIGSVPTSISYGFVQNAVYNASFDIWLDPQPKKDGVNRTEIMIWFNRVGPIQPIGSRTDTATVGGRTWEVWTGNNGGNDVISFVAPSALPSWSFDVMDFVDQTVARGMAAPAWYLTSIQAGFEPWQGGAGLAVHSFSTSVEDGDGGGGGEEPPAGAGACAVTYTPNVWQGGFTAEVTVRNSGTAPVDGWNLGFTLPSGQSVTSAWNAALTPSAGAVTARNVNFNRRIQAGATQSFGFQGAYTGAFAEPSAFTLNGTTCSVL
ncbi:GH12 family glycosyl hydrolase domain-containing protein [Streptomyces genisteinicus]|uniref:Cellulose binding domain-containing protein n=1 Tax=Streptomyces genisteinicus TaxID=2768068 RepID=A0A7H0HN67_9ACTN|nr:cellulose binding domain-containing protein [Streptomyces genisteinicus]QNP61983.1 cellulose binding domain-containing protein [Streptomyces genisteinicus]